METDGPTPMPNSSGTFFMRIGFYVDGFNVYGAICDLIREKGHPYQNHLKWVSYRSLCTQIARSVARAVGQPVQIQSIDFFTTIPKAVYDDSGNLVNGKTQSRHKDFMAALSAEGVVMHQGRFKELPLQHCGLCGGPVTHCGAQHLLKPKLCEKETDVSLAVKVVADAVGGDVDAVVILSTDSDIAPAARMIKSRCPHVKVFTVAVAPRTHSKGILQHSDHKLLIDDRLLANHLLPGLVQLPNGSSVRRPVEYDPPQ